MIEIKDDDNIKRQKVESSLFKSIGYNKLENLLQVEFNNGDVYNYFEITEEMYNNLLKATSVGKYYLANIKGKFNSIKI